MNKLIHILLFLSVSFVLNAQKPEWSVFYGHGISSLINENTLYHRFGTTKFAGTSMILYNSNKHLAFNPALSYGIENYIIGLPLQNYFSVTQNKFKLDLDMLLKISKGDFLRVGIAIQKIDRSYLEITFDQSGAPYSRISLNSSRYWYSNSDIYNGYSSNNFQVGIRAGISIPFHFLKQELSFDLIIQQMANSIVTKDFVRINNDGSLTKVLSARSKPIFVLATIHLKLKKRTRNKNVEEQ